MQYHPGGFWGILGCWVINSWEAKLATLMTLSGSVDGSEIRRENHLRFSKPCKFNGINCLSTAAGFLPSTVFFANKNPKSTLLRLSGE